MSHYFALEESVFFPKDLIQYLMHQKAILSNIFNGLEHLKDEIGAILTSTHRLSIWDKLQWICLAKQNYIIRN